MAIRRILLEDDPVLRKKSKLVTVFNDSLRELFDDMTETLDKAEGAGLSAVQVGILKRMFIIYDHKNLVKVVNPEIIKQSGVCKITAEGCLSVPGKWGDVERPNRVVATYQDEYGNMVKKEFTGFAAKAFCHECDHLDGILFTDKATNLARSYEEYARNREKMKKD